MGCKSTKESPQIKLAEPTGIDNNLENNITNENDGGIYQAKPTDSSQDDGKCIIGNDFIPPPGGRLEQIPVSGGMPVNLEEIQNQDPASMQNKTIKLKSGGVYIGEWNTKTIKKEGKGVLKSSDGSEYSGQFKEDKAWGEGEWKGSDGCSYSGQWKAGRVDGHGRFVHADGSIYEGQWVEDIKEGKGKEIWPDGTIFEGIFVEGSKKGDGKIKFHNGAEYVGQFDEFFNGKGKYVWPNGHTYEGYWKDGLMDGEGTYVWGNEGQFIKYKGEYKEGQKCGKGELYFKDKRIYVGLFQNNKQHGIGYEIWPRGDKRQGEWKDGKLYRWIDDQKKIDLALPANFEKEKDYTTSAYSNPEQYHGLHQTVETHGKKGIILKKNVLLKKQPEKKNEAENTGGEKIDAE